MVSLNICHIWNNFFPIESGGVENYILNLSNALSDSESRMRFLLLTDKCHFNLRDKLFLPSRETIGCIDVFRLGPTPYSFLRNASYKINQKPSRTLDDLLVQSLYKDATRIKALSAVDVFHLHGLWHPLFPKLALQISKHFRRPLVVSLHGDTVNSDEPFCMPLEDPCMLNVLNYASAITTFSLEVKTYLEGLGLGEKVHLIPNFIDVDFFSRPSHLKKNNDQKVVMVSRLDEHKDPLFVIHAFKQVSKVNPQATLLIVGYGSLYEAANDLVKKLGLESVVKFAGNSHANEIKNFLWTHGIFIATRSSYLSVLEAWAAGLAVIAIKDGILGEVITENQNGLLIEQGNITQLADKLSRVIDDPVLRQTLIVNGKQSVKMYDIRTVGGQIADIYRSLA